MVTFSNALHSRIFIVFDDTRFGAGHVALQSSPNVLPFGLEETRPAFGARIGLSPGPEETLLDVLARLLTRSFGRLGIVGADFEVVAEVGRVVLLTGTPDTTERLILRAIYRRRS